MRLMRQMAETASTKRGSLSGGKWGEPSAYLSGLACTPLYPASPEIQQRPELESPYTAKEVYVRGDPDIKLGDILTVAGIDYKIQAMAKWLPGPFLHLVVEESL